MSTQDQYAAHNVISAIQAELSAALAAKEAAEQRFANQMDAATELIAERDSFERLAAQHYHEARKLRAQVRAVEAFCDGWEAPTRRRMHAHDWAFLTRAAVAPQETTP